MHDHVTLVYLFKQVKEMTQCDFKYSISNWHILK